MAIVLNPTHRMRSSGSPALARGVALSGAPGLPTLSDVLAAADGQASPTNDSPEPPSRPAPASHANAPRRSRSLFTAPFRIFAFIASLEIKLKREGENLHIVIAPKAAAARKPRRVDKAVAEAEPLRRALQRFLDLHPLTRRMLRHLGYLEQALSTEGLKAFQQVPSEVLAIALDQLESIVSNWSDRDLADLRSRLAVAVKDRLQDPFHGNRELSDFATASRLMIDDVPHSEFEELQQQYQGLVEPETIQAALDAIRTPGRGDAADGDTGAMPAEARRADAPYAVHRAHWVSHDAAKAATAPVPLPRAR